MSAEPQPTEFEELTGYAAEEYQPALLVSRLLRAYQVLDDTLHSNLGIGHQSGEQLQVLSYGYGQVNHWMYFGRSWMDGSIYASVPGVNNAESPVVVVRPAMQTRLYRTEEVNSLIIVAATLEHTAGQIGKKDVRATIKTVSK